MTRRPRRVPARLTPYGKEPDLKDPGSEVFAPRLPKAKKNLREFCRGNPATPHTTELAFWPRTQMFECSWRPCYRRGQPTGRYFYVCYHREECTRCGKVTVPYLKDPDCPAYTPKPESERL